MSDFRLYLLDRFSGHIQQVEEFPAGSDAEAIACVERRKDRVPTELWCGSRKVRRFDALPESAAFEPGLRT